jgi:hypothetical protein
MREQDRKILKENDNRLVRLHMQDGEVATVKIRFFSEAEQDVIVDLISSTNMGRYEKTDIQPAFQFRFEDIAWVEAIQE